MAKKSKESNDHQQLSLLEVEITDDSNPELSDDDWMSGDDSDFEYTSNLKVETKSGAILTLKLLQNAIKSENNHDLIMQEFSDYILPNLLRVAIGVTAKGGKFFDYLDKKKQEEIENYHQNNLGGNQKLKEPKKIDRRNAGDQSLNTHLLNGLLPANLIERRLKKLDTTARRVIQEQERRLLIAGFILHDFEKFDYRLFLKMPDKYKAICQDREQDIRKLSVDEHREIIDVMVCELGIDKFVSPDEPDAWLEYRDDLLFIAYNAQRRNDTNLNLSEYGLHPLIDDNILICLADLTCLADLLSSIIKHPQDAENQTLNGILHSLSDGKLKFTYHHIAENRGVLTNVVNNAVIQAHTNLNTAENTYYQPLLYLPTGVIYLALRDAPPISPETLPDLVVNKIKSLCAGQLKLRQTGFGRDGKGMKYAEYYNLFFESPALMQVALDATLRILNTNKPSVAKSRSENLVKFQKQNVLSPDYDFKFDDSIRIDQIAEFGDLITRKIWDEIVNKIEAERKKDKKLPEVPNFDLTHKVAEFWNLTEYLPQVREIQRINESLKEQKLKGNTGGVPYEWYYLAAKYLEKHPGIEDVRENCQQVIYYLTDLISPILAQYQLPDGWDDLRLWVSRVVMLPHTNKLTSVTTEIDNFINELTNYNAAKKSGRGKQLICSISHSAYTVTEQMESAVLFTPQVYTNKQMLGGSNAKRNISSIAGVEMMLRQILMNQTQAVGKRFEDGKYRYLYFYPTYYFTPETNKFLQKAYMNIAQTRFDTSIRNHFISKDLQVDLGKENYQSVDSFLIDENLDSEKDRTFKLSYPEDQPLTFYFMALPPGRDSTDTESWIMPSWLAFAFPMILDVKTVVSESPIPPFNDGTEFEETVFLDSAPHAFRTLVKRDRFRLDYILEGWKEYGIQYPAPLNVLTAAYAIHLDVNARQGKTGYDANWGKFTELAKDFETSPLHVFAYLNKWVRNQKVETARIEKIKLYTYHFYPCFDPYAKFDSTEEKLIVEEKSTLNHPKKLTELYRRFYLANKKFNPKANAVLKPIDIAAETILNADLSVFNGETLIMAVAGKIFKLMERVNSSTAEGRWVFKRNQREDERQAVLEFARYFVEDVFDGCFKSDRARLAGRQLNLIRDTCEFLYRLEDDKENAGKDEKSKSEDDDNQP
ncbi:MAG: type I-D CRISPR-associated protein Cas10d/Csc3 [Dolichospermum sp. DET50]|nr:type I-D CRISPR-associated protein Cas10d/Csc3 [Dolichospermum sp. DET66]MBS3033744.1 type I-D CRISPR-associated protein Cas10d/Csc3 [Dolichospermum sp. DET67]MBS3038947.1 type I-D CRISPR-associated protein Cas10d/Csc3 [Dolichospermum sp. DET50]QSX66201.1 MAG: type I-D CRISPR-associated protein Cas10d/Csc3 [Dolichospermum sp. DET69]